MTRNQAKLIDWFQGKTKHLIVTGDRGIGKTTLVDWFDQVYGPFSGYKSFKQGDQTMLQARLQSDDFVLGRRVGQRMKADDLGFHKATEHLIALQESPSPVIVLDEVGYMERLVPSFVDVIVALAQKKRLLLVVRRDDNALESRYAELGSYDYLDLNESPRSLMASSSDKS